MAVMKRQAALCLSAMTLGFSVLPAQALAQDNPTTDEASEVVVTATRSARPLRNLPLSVSVVREDELSRHLHQTTNVLSSLELIVPGLSIQGSEVRGSCGSSLRGRPASFQVNGVPVNEDLRQGSCTAPYGLSPFAIERIEVVRGGTALYGSGAPGGIVNLITRRAAGEKLEVDVTAQTSFNTSGPGDTGATDVYLGAGQRVGDFDYYAGIAVTDAEMIRDAEGDPVYSTAYRALDFNGALGWNLGAAGNVRVMATYHDEDPGRAFYPDSTVDPVTGYARIVDVALHPQQDQALDQSSTLTVAYSHPELLGHSVQMSLFLQDQSIKQRENFFTAASGNDFFASNRENTRQGFRSAFVRDYSLGAATVTTSYGFDYTRNSFLRFTVDPANNEALTGYISPEVVLRTYAAYGQAEATAGKWRLSAGVRQEWYRGEVTDKGYNPALPRAAKPGDFGETDLALFNAGAVYDLSEDTQVYAGFSQGAELSQIGRAARGIQDPSTISPEPATSDQYEVGIRGQAGAFTYDGAVYYSTSESAALLQADPTCAGQSLCTLIPLRSPQRFAGVEGNVRWAASDTLALRAVLTVQRGEVYDDDAGQYINYSTDTVVPLRLTLGADWRPNDRLNASLTLNHYGASSYVTPVEAGLGFVETDAQTLLSGSIGYKLPKGEIYLAGDNLTNADYVLPANAANGSAGFFYYRAPGRRLTVGYKARF